jgi:tRNA(fMet)-specific endonuclease VapC
MADKIVLADTSILIDYFRKTDKSNSTWVKLVRREYNICISVVTEFEIYSGAATQRQLTFWNDVLQSTKVLAFDQAVVKKAVTINTSLKRKRKQIDLADLFIAATAISNNLPFTTLNRKHFDRIDELNIIE